MTMAEQVQRIPLLPPSEQNPRNSEGAFVRLKDGRVLFVYSHFYGGGADHAEAYLAGRYSDNGGRTWTQEDVMVLENEGGCNVMSVSLMRMANDDIGLFYLRKDHEVKLCRGFLRRSTDEGETWSDAVLCTPRRAYNVVNNDRVVALASGRLLMPASLHFPVEDGDKRRPGRATCYLSDDDGLSWEHASTQIEPPQGSVGLRVPTWAVTTGPTPKTGASTGRRPSRLTSSPGASVRPVSDASRRPAISLSSIPTTATCRRMPRPNVHRW